MTNEKNHRELALAYHQRLPARIKSYLHSRGIPDLIIHRYRLGWDGERITIPITNQDRQVTFFRLAKDPEDTSISPEILSSSGAYPELYGWERLTFSRDELVVCETEFERLLLEAHCIPAVTSTHTRAGFLNEWAKAFREIPNVFICCRATRDAQIQAEQIARLIPQSRVAQLPDDVGVGGTIEDFFVRLGNRREDFIALLERAERPAGDDRLIPPIAA